MSVDVAELCAFYASPLGEVACRFVGRVLGESWTDLSGLRVLGIGFAVPYLSGMAPACERATAFMPAAQGVVHWPSGRLPRSALVDPLMLPLGDASVDRVLVVHGLELVESPAELLHEIGRVLAPAGRVILVCPNRRGLWARMDTTPFGQGQPFSRKQLRQLLLDASLAAERWSETLYMPPIASRLALRSAGMWERCGARLSLPFAGLHIVEATRHLRRPVVVGHRHPFRPRSMLQPIPAPRSARSPTRRAGAWASSAQDSTIEL